MSGSKKNLASELCTSQRRQLVDFGSTELPVSKQAELLGLNRTSLYYRPVPPSREDLDIKMHIDKIYTAIQNSVTAGSVRGWAIMKISI